MTEAVSSEQVLAGVRAFWGREAARFDDELDHGLADRAIRSAWSARLRAWVPATLFSVIDLGCGTGSLSVLLAEQGHRVTGVDIAPEMVAAARSKLAEAGHHATFVEGDVGRLPVGTPSFDAVLARHLLWTLPAPEAALESWIRLIRPGGRLVCVEGQWDPAPDAANPEGSEYLALGSALPWFAGCRAMDLVRVLQPLASRVTVEPLNDPALWGRAVDDERYAVIADVGR